VWYVGQNMLISLGLLYGVMLAKICIFTVRVRLIIYLIIREAGKSELKYFLCVVMSSW